MKHNVKFDLRLDSGGFEIIKSRAKKQGVSMSEFTRRLIRIGLSVDAGATPDETERQLKRLRSGQAHRLDTTVTSRRGGVGMNKFSTLPPQPL